VSRRAGGAQARCQCVLPAKYQQVTPGMRTNSHSPTTASVKPNMKPPIRRPRQPLMLCAAWICQVSFLFFSPSISLEVKQQFWTRLARPWGSGSFQARQENSTVEIAAALVRKAIVAYGGESNMASFKNAMFQYQVETPGDPASKPIQVKAYFKEAIFFRSEVSGGGSDALTILNRDKGWVKVGDTTLSLTKRSLDPLKTAMISQLRPDLLLLSFQKFRYAGKGEEQGRKLELVDISGFVGGEYIRGRLSFDSQTNLIYKYEFEIERELPGGKGIVEGEEKYVRYLETEGLKVPAEIASRQGRKVVRITMNQVDFSTELNSSLFEDPTPAAPPSAR
jgi:hypothetical protein